MTVRPLRLKRVARSAVAVRGSIRLYGVVPEVAIFNTLVEVDTALLGHATYVITLGHTTLGDKGAASYKVVNAQPSHPGKRQSLDGKWIEIAVSHLNVEMLGAKCDGVTNDTTAFNNAIATAKAQNIACVYHEYGTSVIDGEVDVLGGVTLTSGAGLRAPKDAQHIVNYRYGGVIHLNPSTGSIKCTEPGAGVNGLIIVAKGITIPANRTQVNAWTGRAITIIDSMAGCVIRDNYIIGFLWGIYSAGTNTDKLRVENNALDCINGIFIESSHDVSYCNFNQMYPYASAALGGATSNDLKRGGKCFYYKSSDFIDSQGNFAFGWTDTHYLEDCLAATLVNCGADNHADDRSDTPTSFTVTGTTRYTELVGCTASGASIGLLCNLGADDMVVHIKGGRFFGLGTVGFSGLVGYIDIDGVFFENMPKAVISGSTAGFAANNCVLQSVALATFDCAGGPAHVGDANIIRANVAQSSIALAPEDFVTDTTATLPFPSSRRVAQIAGSATATTSISTQAYPGREIFLRFVGGRTINNTATIKLNGAANKAFDTPDILHLIWDGAAWIQPGVNH